MAKISLTDNKKLLTSDFSNIYSYETFRKRVLEYIARIDEAVSNNENEEHVKNIINDFLRMNFYSDSRFSINTDGYIDSTIKENGRLYAIIETKQPSNKNEMPSENSINKKALWEAVYYFMERTIDVTKSKPVISTESEVRRLIITNGYQWFLFDASEIHKIIKGEIVTRYFKYKNNQLPYKNDSATFYDELRQQFENINISESLEYVYFDIKDCLKTKKTLKLLFISLSEVYLLKNSPKTKYNPHSLNSGFYHELLYIMGFKEVIKDNKPIVEIDRTIKNSLSDQVYNLLKEKELNSSLLDEMTFELVLIWINRLLFIKLFEGQLISFNSDNEEYHIISRDKIHSFDDLQNLFFDVLGTKDRTDSPFHDKFKLIPYLNSSLFEKQTSETKFVFISYLKNDKIERKSKSVLGKKSSSSLPILDYIIDFLNSYNFSSYENDESNHGEIIDSAVLGLIFEKLNGYKEGANYTPSVITEYIAREAIEGVIIQAVNNGMGWKCENLDDIEDKIATKDERVAINNIINSIKICDPAVGSGHFLVSALNRIIAIKKQLGVLFKYNSNARVKEYEITVEDDILVVRDGNGDPFVYNKNNNESREIQETLFNEKRIIIENCLFGVDINAKAVYICQLRLWIELLKNAYYKDGVMETLPNIDINIKVGNSLIHRYKIDIGKRITFNRDDLSDQELKDFKNVLKEYKKNVAEYKKVSDKTLKKQIISNIEQVKKRLVESQITMFDKYSPTFFDNICEWVIEFPDVLDEDGKLIGFDAIIGNPPYIQLQSMKEEAGKLSNVPYKYETYEKTGDIYCLFYEQGYRLLKDNGILAFVTSNKWMRAGYGKSLRNFINIHTNPITLIDFAGQKVFDSATVDVNILIFKKIKNQHQTKSCIIMDSNWRNNLSDYVEQNSEINSFSGHGSFVILSDIEQSIKRKIEAIGTPLRDWDININYGIKTGCNEAFIIDGKKKDELIAADPKSAEIIRPILRGRDIKRYSFEHNDLWLIYVPWHFPLHNDVSIQGCSKEAEKSFEKQYPAIYKHLLTYKEQLSNRNKSETGIRYEWYALQRWGAKYSDDFSKQKIVWGNLCLSAQYTIVDEDYFINAPSAMITGGNKYLLAIMNSKVADWYIRKLGVTRNGGYFEYKPMFVEQIPIPIIDIKVQAKYESLVNQILNKRVLDENIKQLEDEIDRRACELYDLSREEIEYISR